MRNKAGAWFNGVDSYIEVPDNPRLNFPTQLSIVVEMFITERNKHYERIVSKGHDQSYDITWRIDGTIAFTIISAAGIPYRISPASPPALGFLRVIGRYNGNVMELFYNKQLVRSYPVNTTVRSTSAPLTIGGIPGGKHSRQTIHRVLLFNRAISNYEIDGNFYDDGLVMHHDYRLGHALDLSGNGNHGIPYNVQFVGVYTKKGLWCPGQDDAYVEIPEAVISGDDDYTVAVEFADIQPGKLFQHGNDLIIELEGETLKAYRINSASEQETVTYNLPQFSGMAIARKVGNNLELLWNGVSVGSVAVTGDALPDTVWQIGNALRGNIKGVIAYQRALDDVEINRLLNRQLPPHPSLYYDFRLGHADDLSGHGRDGILHGELLWI